MYASVKPATMLTIASLEWVTGGGFAFVLEGPNGQRGAWFPRRAVENPPQNEEQWVKMLSARPPDSGDIVGVAHNKRDEFLTEDPRGAYPDWDQDVWDRIRIGVPLVGMTRTMVDFICGQEFEKARVGVAERTATGFVTYDRIRCVAAEGPTGTVWFELLMEGNRVVQVLDSRGLK